MVLDAVMPTRCQGPVLQVAAPALGSTWHLITNVVDRTANHRHSRPQWSILMQVYASRFPPFLLRQPSFQDGWPHPVLDIC